MTNFYLKLIVLLNFIVIIGSFNSKYCNICVNHVLCKYNRPGPSSDCLRYDRSALLSRSDVAILLNRVNEKRNFVALGLSRNLPQAANMRKIMWSEELALFAQRWVDQCVPVSFREVTDDCRDLENAKVGQIIATVKGPAPGLSVKAFVDIWFMQALQYNGSTSFYNQSRDFSTDFFTQLIWAETDSMGCGKAKFYTKSRKLLLERMICNFAPKGNIHGKPVYTIGIPSTQCPFNTVPDDKYDGLCKPDNENIAPLTPASPPVSSLLRIINLSNQMPHKGTDLNRNYKKNLNHVVQKIRHIFNNTDLKELSTSYKPSSYEARGYNVRDHDLSKNHYSKKHNVRRVTKSMIPFQSCRRHNRGPLCTRKHTNINIARSENECKSGLVTDQCTRLQKAATASICTTNNNNYQQPYSRCTCCNIECQTPTTKCSAYRCGQNIQMFDSRRSEKQPVNSYPNVLQPTKNTFHPLAISSALSQNNHFGNYQSARDHFENHNPQVFPNQDDHDSHSDWLSKRRRRKAFAELPLKPFWQMEDYRPRNPPQLKSMKYTTIPQRKKLRTWKTTLPPQVSMETEPITIDFEEMPNDQRRFGTEKYLSFDELMRLRKLGGNDNFLYARRKGNSTTAPHKNTTTSAATKATKATDATTLTTNTPFKRLKHCTRKVTCTWSAATGDDDNKGGGGGGGNGKGKGGGGGGNGKGHHRGSRTPPGYVEGCTRTFTCTRDYMERNKKPSSPKSDASESTEEDEDYCEKRALNVERRNLDKKYSTYVTFSLFDTFTEDPSLFRTAPVYDDSPQPKREALETCYCNQNFARNKRDVQYDYEEGPGTNELKSSLSYADLFYLVVKKIIKNADKGNKLHKKNCLCSSSTKNYMHCLFFIYLLLFYFLNR